MVKERRAQTGATNLSARGESFRAVSRGAVTGTLVNSNSSSNLSTHNLTATWKPAKVPDRDFLTIHKETYQNPKEYKDSLPPPKTTLQIAEEKLKHKNEVEAVDNLCQVVRATHGTVGSMLRSFNKKPLDNFSLFEFNEYMKRNNLETYLTESEQKLIFDYVDEGHKGSVPVKEFLKKVEEREFHDQEYNKDALKIRDFISLHIAQARSESPEVSTPELDTIKRKKGVENEAMLMRRALGMKTFNVDVDPEELDEFIDRVNTQTLPKDHAQRRYARFLHHSNIQLKNVPFYDMRANELNRLKERSARIELLLETPEMKGKFEDLSRTRWQNSLTTHSLTDQDMMQWTIPKQYSLDNIHDNPDNPGTGLNFNLSKSLPNLRPSPLANIEIPSQGNDGPLSVMSVLSDGDRPVTSASNRVQLDAIRPATSQPPKYRDLTGSNNNNNNYNNHSLQAEKPKIYAKPKPTFTASDAPNDDMSSSGTSFVLMGNNNSNKSSDSISGAQSMATSPSNKTRASKLIEGHLDKAQPQGALQEVDFYTHVIDETQSMGRLKDPSKIMRIEKIDPKVYNTTTGKRMIDQGPTDWSRVGVGGNRDGNDIGYGYEQDDRFLTTTNSYYPPLIYEPSQPVSRHLISEADIAHQKRDYIRQQRAARTRANLEVTKTRLEYEALQKEIRSLNRQSSRIDNAIRYKTNFLLNDLQHFRVQPLQRMAKRQNIHLSEKMFGGSMDKQTVGIVDDNRDFQTTYSSSYLHNLGNTNGSIQEEHE